ncbi:dynein regulatory complex subunit 4 isoform X1 [Takifugu rubripes]|uniref:Dynein regulatory complex subunit 4 n=2 Tax=Takifugu rubripes TaxID=31033 RepID=H2TEW4_TAKRU|nr:dynein regulatory complex subunit 4 isoform X1 [Takifugu rubripes]|eukprot:XP_011610972.1 PREDICTED: growth arrest-specific protein 8 isoform X2 [Takifugu rubripes]
MPPKRSKSKKVAKGEQSAVVDCLSTEEMTKDQLVEHFVRLREELDREREEKSFFQLERDKIREFWEISKRSLEEANAQLRNQQREKEEAEECHRVEITVFKQKLKNVLSEQQNAMAKMKMEGVATAMLVQNRNMEAELGLRRDVSSLHANCREKEHHTHNSLRELQLKHQVELMDLASSYDRRIKETEEKYLKNLQSLLEAEGKQRQAEIKKLDEQMKSQMVTLKEEHDRAHREAEEYYSAVQRKLLEDQKLLKREMTEATKVQAKAGRELSAAEQENTRLREAVQEAEHKLIQAQEQAEQSRKKKARMKVRNVQIRQVEKELRDQKVEHELLLQCCWELEQERDELLRTQADTILELQQKIGLKEQLLQRKMEALTEAVENREAQLYAVLSAANLDPTTASDTTKKLQDILDSGDVTIKALQMELSASCED